jgi:hypothetical protein
MRGTKAISWFRSREVLYPTLSMAFFAKKSAVPQLNIAVNAKSIPISKAMSHKPKET